VGRLRALLRATTMGAIVLASSNASAAPKHDICIDVGSTLGLGISSYGAAAGWPEKAKAAGVPWRFLYFYVFPSEIASKDLSTFIADKSTIAKGLGAMPVITFYDLLKRGYKAGLTQRAGSSNAEADVVQQVLESPTLMRAYFDGFVDVLKAASSTSMPTLVHVEPDSFGFMMWAMGVEGRTDPTTIAVKVAASGHPDLAGLPDHAGGFGKALLALRDKYAPTVRLGWHASNFRVGARPDVVTSFYAGMGEWDAIVTEDPHVMSDEAKWWLPLDPAKVDANVAWTAAVSKGTRLPVLMWQVFLGPLDFHFFGEPGGRAVLQRFVSAGLVAMMWEQLGAGDPDSFRGIGLAVPPTDSTAGGTAKDLRERLAVYAKDPITFAAGNPCASSSSSDAGVDASPPSDGTIDSAIDSSANATASDESPGCGCRTHAGRSSYFGASFVALALLLARRRR